MFNILIDNSILQKSVKQLLEAVFDEKTRAQHDTEITIVDQGKLDQAINSGVKNILFLCYQDAGDSAPLPLKVNQVFLPLKPGQFLRKCQDIFKKETVPDFEKEIKIQRFIFLPYEFSLICDDGVKKVILTEKERNILLLLHAAGDFPVSREKMLKEIWNYVPDIETHTLETHIYRLRQKIEQDPSEPKILVTEEKGYRLLV
ncbi:MAG: hypothetical protein CMH31_07025 [Micavibrio sp.]|nr:hypothetical protein [Micavibrio sp.]